MNRVFDHEKLEVYQAALAFLVWLEPLPRKLPKPIAFYDQLDRASTSIVLNLAEGNVSENKVDLGMAICYFSFVIRNLILNLLDALLLLRRLAVGF